MGRCLIENATQREYTSGAADEETNQFDDAQGADSSHKPAVSNGGSEEQETDPGRVHQGDRISSQTRDPRSNCSCGYWAGAAIGAPHLSGSGKGSTDCAMGS